jgi:hypothetical protein
MEQDVPVETGAAMAKAAMERTVATMVVNFILAVGVCWFVGRTLME